MRSALLWIILFAPLLSAAVITLFTRFSGSLSAAISVAAVSVTFIASCLVFPAASFTTQFEWLDVGSLLSVPIGLTLDSLSKAMLLVVTGVGALIHIYSLGYMARDEGKSRYFAGLSLFMFSMLGIVLANNFVMMFIFWELVGVSSYILIGHWFRRDSAADAAKKAFITNRIGDFGFMLGILIVWTMTGSVIFSEVSSGMDHFYAHPNYLTICALLIFCGAAGKSAQVPLHVWLPDAMEGPTPVSALIHAATMVAAGVYMLARVFFLVGASRLALDVIAWTGVITALLAALMATQQNDIKRILAYSTLSQLGYMVMAIGLASRDAAMFHLITHAFFKALLFLGAGSIIHSLHHEQDIWKMGGIKNEMPVTFLAFLAGTLALTGCPLLSGFFSKDMILAAAYDANRVIFWIALFTAFLTAYYMIRLFVVVFLGGPKSDAALKAHENSLVMLIPLLVLAFFSVIAGYGFFIGKLLPFAHKAEHSWTVPGLAFCSFFLGVAVAGVIYAGKKRDPIFIPLFANKFYFDEFYARLIRWTQDLLAEVSSWVDRWILDGIFVQGGSRATWVAGYILRFLQVGNLQAYSFLFGAGVVWVIYLILFK
jgi:NADH-quinone oxidoreductase subunit L